MQRNDCTVAVGQKAHGLGLEIHRLAEVSERALYCLHGNQSDKCRPRSRLSRASFKTTDHGRSFFARMFARTR